MNMNNSVYANRLAKQILAALLILTMCFSSLAVPISFGSAKAEAFDQSMEESAIKLVASLASLIVEATPEAAIGAVVEWGIGEILDLVFGKEMSSEEEEYFNRILEGIAELQSAVAELQETVDSQYLANLLNSYKELGGNKTPSLIYNALKAIDESKNPEAWKKTQRLSILTDSLGASGAGLADITHPFDIYTQSLAEAMLTAYDVSVGGEQQKLMLLQVQYEYLRKKYRWENQGIEEWMTFQSQALGLLIETLTIEKLSLQARLVRIADYNATLPPEKQISDGAVRQLLGQVQKYLNSTHTIYGKDNTWMAKPHGEDERYYWVPGHEMLLYATVSSQDIPVESNLDVGYQSYNWEKYIKGMRLKLLRPYGYPVWSFWKPFFRPNPTRLLTQNELQVIFQDYKGEKSFYDIFIGEDEGNFQGLIEGDSTAWKMVFDPASHNLECHAHLDDVWERYYTIEGWFFDATKKGSMPKAKKAKIYRYWRDRNAPADDKAFIGIRVKQGMKSLQEDESIHLTTGTDEISCGWVGVDGDLVIDLGGENHSAVQAVEADGLALSSEYYTYSSDQVTISKRYLETLADGAHAFVVRTDIGTITLTFCAGPAIGMRMPANLREIDETAFVNIGAKSVVIDDSCMRIGDRAFAGNKALQWIYIPSSVEEIGEEAFAGCDQLLIICPSDSKAAEYAEANGIRYREKT